LVLALIACGVAAAGLVFQTGCTKTASDTVEARTFRFTYSVSVVDIPEGAHDLSLWIPLPTTDPRQTVRRLDVTAPIEYRVTRDPQYGNSMIYLSAKPPLPSKLELQIEALIEREAYTVIPKKPRRPGRDKPATHDLEPDALVPIDGIIAEQARTATAGATTPLEKARAIYNYVTDTMTYDKSGEGWGRGDALFACATRAGNCTDFHSLIIGMARACGIPARFVMGFPLPEDQANGEIPGYHCWAEMYIDGIGWLPMDSSEASKHPEKRESLFGGLDADRVQFTRGRDVQLEPRASEPMNYFIYPHVEVDGVRHSSVERHFSFLDVNS
jgi:transglutaminase-like putative cysteine protease